MDAADFAIYCCRQKKLNNDVVQTSPRFTIPRTLTNSAEFLLPLDWNPWDDDYDPVLKRPTEKSVAPGLLCNGPKRPRHDSLSSLSTTATEMDSEDLSSPSAFPYDDDQMRREDGPPTPNFQRRRPARLAGFPFSPSPRCKDPISREMTPAGWEGRYYRPHPWEKNDISRNESGKEPDPIDNPYTPDGGKRMFARRGVVVPCDDCLHSRCICPKSRCIQQ